MSSTNPKVDLPWLVNGTIDDQEKVVIEAALNDSVDLRREQEFLVAMRNKIKQQTVHELPVEFAWQRLHRDIKAEKISVQKMQSVVSPLWRITTIAASVVLVFQSAIILNSDKAVDQYQPLSSEILQNTLKIRFKDSATQLKIQLFLRQHQLRIIDGPSADGFYQLHGKSEQESLLKILKAEPGLIDYVQLD